MKKLIIIIAALLSTKTFATNYYFSNAGNDNNTGTSSSFPFKTIDKLNTLVLIAGDSILLHCGDIFRGQINIAASGNSSNYIVFASYGSGNKPIISGANAINNWVLNGNRYEAALTTKPNNFFANDKEQTIARYPNNNQYLTLDSAQKTYLKDASLSSVSSNNFTGAWVCVHTAQWCWEKSAISSFTGTNKIAYKTPMHLAAINNYGYFIYDNINLLDTANEWKYDSAAATIYYIPASGANPNNQSCEAAVYSNGIAINSNASYIIISNIQFEKQMNAGVSIGSINNRYIKMSDCVFARQYNYGCSDKGKYNEISHCSFSDIDGIAMFINGSGCNSTIHHNNLTQTGLVRNNGIGQEINGTAIKVAFGDSCLIHHNTIDSAGYCGISVDGTYNTIEKNIISNVMLCNNDGGALKSFGGASHHNIFQNNFVTTSDGNRDGAYQANFITPAIYFDFNVNNSIIKNNTVYGRTQKGIFQNAGDSSNTIEGNIIYGANVGIDLNSSNLQPTLIKNMNIKKNVFWLKNKTDYVFRQIDTSGNYNYGNIDSNYYFQPYSSVDSLIFRLNGLQLKPYSLSNWRSAGNDIHTTTNNFRWAIGTDSSAIFINATDNAVAQNLQGYMWKDLDGNIVSSLTLQPWTSKVLIKTTTVLPVDITNYQVKLNTEKFVVNSWSFANEVNLLQYNIQRSSNSKIFETVGTIAAKGINGYEFSDNIQRVNANTLYYRIEAVDVNGAKSYSEVKQVTINKEQLVVNIYPNPVRNELHIVVDSKATIKLYNIAGKQFTTNALTQGDNNINIQQLSQGVYVAVIETANGVVTMKIIKEQ